MNSCVRFAGVRIMTAVAAVSLAWPVTPQTIPHRGDIVLDGSIEEWGVEALIHEPLQAVDGSLATHRDLDVAVMFAWNDSLLLCALDVWDECASEETDPDLRWRKDAIELFVCTDVSVPELHQWVITPGCVPGLEAGWTLFHYRDGVRDTTTRVAPRIARTLRQGGYTIEIGIPLAAPGYERLKGTALPLLVRVNDHDTTGTAASHVSLAPIEKAFMQPQVFPSYRLGEKEAGSRRAIFRVVHDTASLVSRVTVIAGHHRHGQTVTLRDGRKKIGTLTLQLDSTGRAVGSYPVKPLRAPLTSRRIVALAGDDTLGGVTVLNAATVARLSTEEGVRRLCERFLIDTPWKPATALSALERKYRGFVARYITAATQPEATMGAPVARIRDELITILEAIDEGRDYLAPKRNTFLCAVYNEADGTGQPCRVHIPYDFDTTRHYPLVVDLHGSSGRPVPEEVFVHRDDYIGIAPWAHTGARYSSYGAKDVMRAIEYAREWYPVDSSRIYLQGHSLGAMGSWVIGAANTDLFAAVSPKAGFPQEAFLDNLVNTPVLIQHGVKDYSVSVDHARWAADVLLAKGYPVEYEEYPEAPHGLSWATMDHGTEWLLRHRMNHRPLTIVRHGDIPARMSAHWVRVLRFTDVHAPARLVASVDTGAAPAVIRLFLDNVHSVVVDVNGMPLDTGCSLIVQAGSARLPVPPDVEKVCVYASGDGYALRPWRGSSGEPARRPYLPGAAANLYSGEEPIRIVYGTAGDAEADSLLAAFARTVSRHAGSRWRHLLSGSLPVRSDRALSREELAECNLVLLGSPSENAITAKVMKRIPLTLEADRLFTDPSRTIARRGSGVSLYYKNPLAPKRAVYLLFAGEGVADAREWYARAPHWLQGMDGSDRVNQPDLVVRTYEGAIRMQAQLDTAWRWIEREGGRGVLTEDICTRGALDRVWMQLAYMRNPCDLVLKREREEVLFEAGVARGSDYAFVRPSPRVATGWLPGAVLVRMLSGEHEEVSVLSWPATAVADVDTSRRYRVAMARDDLWMTQAFETALSGTRAGKPVDPAVVRRMVLEGGAMRAGTGGREGEGIRKVK